MSPAICIVIPAYNEEHAIGETIREYKEHFPDARFVVVDNNSRDATGERARQQLDPGRDLLIFEGQQGKGAAVKAGLSRVVADIYVMTDGDGTYPAADARVLTDMLLQRRCDMMVGDRVAGGTYGKQNTRAGHTFGNKLLSRYVSFVAGQKFNDVLSGLRVMSRPFVTRLDVSSSGFQLETELNMISAYARAKVLEHPVDYRPRPEGSHSKLSTFADGGRIVWFALLNWITFFPLYAFGLVAAVALVVSAILGSFVILVFLDQGILPYPSTAVAAATAGLVGLQALFSGLVLKITGRHSRRRDVAELLELRRAWNERLDATKALDT